MSLKPFFTEGGFGVSNSTANTTTTVVYANTDIQTANISVTGTSNLGAVGNVKITGGSSGYVLSTNGAGSLSWVAQSGNGGGGAGNSVSNMPSYIPTGNSFTLSANYQGLFAEPITIDGDFEILGDLIDVAPVPLPANISATTLSASGNIVGQYIIGNGYYLTGISGNGGGGGQNPGGANSSVQINDNGTFNGTTGFTFNTSTNAVTMLGVLTASGVSAIGNVTGNYFIGNGSQLTGITGSSFSWNIVSSNTTMTVNKGYFVDTSAGAKTMTLPSSATLGDTIRINDLAGTFGTNNLTVARNGGNIQGVAQDLVVSVNQKSFGLVYSNSTYGWKLMEL